MGVCSVPDRKLSGKLLAVLAISLMVLKCWLCSVHLRNPHMPTLTPVQGFLRFSS